MNLNKIFLNEIEQEAQGTKKLLERVPLEKSDWKPHEKSTALGRLATHIAELPGWIPTIMDADELDFAKMEYKPRIAANSTELMTIFEENISKGKQTLQNAKDEDFEKTWTMRNGDQIYFTHPKVFIVRSFAFNHLYHHRAQLTVFLRLLNVPLPNIYGPTADEPM